MIDYTDNIPAETFRPLSRLDTRHKRKPPIPGTAQGTDTGSRFETGLPKSYLTTHEAARYMRRSASWMLRQKDIPYYRGKPNLYRRTDLDDWLNTKRRHEPKGGL